MVPQSFKDQLHELTVTAACPPEDGSDIPTENRISCSTHHTGTEDHHEAVQWHRRFNDWRVPFATPPRRCVQSPQLLPSLPSKAAQELASCPGTARGLA